MRRCFLAVVPLYLRLLGAEAYGLVGLFTTVMVAATALDLGLGATLNREVARLTAQRRRQRTRLRATSPPRCRRRAGWSASSWAALFAARRAGHRHALAELLDAVRRRGARRARRSWAWRCPRIIVRGVYLAGLNGLQRQALANLLQTGGTAVRARRLGRRAARWSRRRVAVFFVVADVLL